MKKDFRLYTAAEFKAALDKHGGERGFARAIGVSRTTIQYWRHKIERGDYRQPDRVLSRREELKLPKEGEIAYAIFTSAQDSTRINTPFWENLKAYATALDAQLFVSGFTYNKSLFEEHRVSRAEFHPALEPHMTNHPVNVGHSMVFCGEMNILPTAVDPLSGYDSYTMSRWGIFPHPKIMMRSVPVMQSDPNKVIMTTGCVTEPNFIQKNAGIKAEFHHTYGAVLVPYDHLGNFFSPRYLFADETGGFYDLDVRVEDGKFSYSESTAAVTWGDIHLEKLNPMVSALAFGFNPQDSSSEMVLDPYSIRGVLNPRQQFVHDVIDFGVRLHHSIADPVHRFVSHHRTTDQVEDAFDEAADFLESLTLGQEGETVVNVVYSNHTNEAMAKWLRNADHRNDPANALFFLQASLRFWQALADGVDEPDAFNLVMADKMELRGNLPVNFLSFSDSIVICPDANGGIESAMHGHLGANGARANPKQFARTGRKSNTAHIHAPGICEGNWQAGHSCDRYMGYNKGLTSWGVAHILTYLNGKRCMLFQDPDGAWCPEVPSEVVL